MSIDFVNLFSLSSVEINEFADLTEEEFASIYLQEPQVSYYLAIKSKIIYSQLKCHLKLNIDNVNVAVR